MIDKEEQNIEEKLKRKISWRSVIKTIIALVLMIFAYLLIQYSQSGLFPSQWSYLSILLLCIASILIVPPENKEKNVRQTLSIVKCKNCNVRLVKDYSDGDYLYKSIGTSCPKCGGKMEINQIYSVKLIAKDEKEKESNRN